MHLTIKERVELVLMSGADGVCYYYLNCFICFGALFMAQNVCYYYLNCFICFGALFMAQNVCYYYLNCFICFGALFMAHPVYKTQCLSVCLSVCLSAIQIKLETFRYKQTYESYITFSREAKYGILISIRIVYGMPICI